MGNGAVFEDPAADRNVPEWILVGDDVMRRRERREESRDVNEGRQVWREPRLAAIDGQIASHRNSGTFDCGAQNR